MKTRWERYRKNVERHYKWSGIGSDSTRLKGYTLPTKEEMKEMSHLRLIYDIDPPIRAMVIDLNRNGLKTSGSCSGHCKGQRAFVVFEPDTFNEKKAVSIMINHGMKRLLLEKPGIVRMRTGEKAFRDYYAINFSPVNAKECGYVPRRGPTSPSRLKKRL